MVKKGVRINWVLMKMEVCSWEKLLACIKLAAKTPENDITRATSCYMGYLSHVSIRTNKYCSDIQRNQTQSPATWNLDQRTQPDYSQPRKNKQTRMRSSTNCFHRWRTLNKTKKLNQNNDDNKKTQHKTSSVAQDRPFPQPHLQKSGQGSRHHFGQPVKNIILCVHG